MAQRNRMPPHVSGGGSLRTSSRVCCPCSKLHMIIPDEIPGFTIGVFVGVALTICLLALLS